MALICAGAFLISLHIHREIHVMSHRALARRALYVASLCALGFAGTVYAGGVSQPTVGSTNVVVADPGVPRPAGTPCVVQLFNENYTDASNHPFNYAPPAGCEGS